jgi:phosphate/phosphite/phosphonate ABC transporter binding protein
MAAEERIGRYRILQLLGRGGMGDVYLAGAQGAAGFEKPVVLKILRPKYGRSPDRIRRLLREAFIGVRLDHQNVVQVFDLGEETGRWFVVMEYVRGFTLAHLIEHAAAGQPLETNAVATIVRAVADAIDYVHHLKDEAGRSLGLIHRDVTPSNVLLGADGRIKLSDFGVAVLTSEDDEGELLAGKPPYLPPEAFKRATATQAWDVYALGATLYEALAGRRPFRGASIREVKDALAAGAEPLEKIRPDCARGLAQMVMQAIHPDADKRFRSAAAFRAALEEAVPRRVDDFDRHRGLVDSIFGSSAFVQKHGSLPTTAGSVASAQLDPKTPPPELDASAPTVQVSTMAPIRLGLSPAHGAGLARSHGDRLSSRLKDVLGREVRPVVVADYRVLIECLATGELDLAWMPPAAFVDAERRGAKALVVAKRCGKTTYESAIIVHADSAFQSIADLRGQSVAWVDRESSSGYLFAVAEIVRELGPPIEVFEKQHFQGSHRAVCEAVANRWAAAGATYAVRDDDGRVIGSGWIDLMGPRAVELRPIAWSTPIPGDNIAYRPQLSGELADLCADALIGLAEDDEGRLLLRDIFNAEAFVRSDATLYDLVRSTLLVAEKAI